MRNIKKFIVRSFIAWYIVLVLIFISIAVIVNKHHQKTHSSASK
jgi:hypothetical protein